MEWEKNSTRKKKLGELGTKEEELDQEHQKRRKRGTKEQYYGNYNGNNERANKGQ